MILTLTYTGTLQVSPDAKTWQDVSDASGGTYQVTTSNEGGEQKFYRVMK